MDPRDQRIAELEAAVASRDAVIAEQQATILALTEKVQQLERTVAELTEKLNRNSRNSHLPPSSDGPGGRQKSRSKGKDQNQGNTKRSSRKRRKRGGQPGHPGKHRKWLPPDQVDEIIDHFPPGCGDCGADLPREQDPHAVRLQQVEIPKPKAKVSEHRCHAVTCACGCTTRARPDLLSMSPFGPRLMSLICLFTGVYHLSRRQTVRVMADVLGVRISLGAVSTIEARVSEALDKPVQQIWKKVLRGAVKHADATSWLLAGTLQSLWTIATQAATVFRIVANSGSETVMPLFGALRGILVSDRATVLSFWAMERRQICWAHLLRKFVAFSQRDGPGQAYGQELLDLTAIIFGYWQDYKDGRLDKETFLAWMAPAQAQVEDCLQRAANAGIAKVSGSCMDILAHRQALWTFVTQRQVEPTNNHAERELRAFVLWRKRSFGAQSDRGNIFAERMMTVAHTANKQGKNILAFLTECCTASVTKTAPPSLFRA